MRSHPSTSEIRHAPFLADAVRGSSGIRSVPCERTRRSARLSRLLLRESPPEKKTRVNPVSARRPNRGGGGAGGYLSSLRHGTAAGRSAAAVHHPVPRLEQAQAQGATQVPGPEDAHRLGLRVTQRMQGHALWLPPSLRCHVYRLSGKQEVAAEHCCGI